MLPTASTMEPFSRSASLHCDFTSRCTNGVLLSMPGLPNQLTLMLLLGSLVLPLRLNALLYWLSSPRFMNKTIALLKPKLPANLLNFAALPHSVATTLCFGG